MASNPEIYAETGVHPLALIFADAMRGTAVHGRDGDKLGSVDRVVLDKRTGQVAFLILSSGKFLGLGGRYHPIPWSALRYDGAQGSYIVAIDRRLLDGAPGYGSDSAPIFDEAYGNRVTEYYRSSLDAVTDEPRT